ncbi:DHHA1 domain-containing protein [Fictibacillus aquaticus]|uniref:Hydrolase n=1 Tax=Fictibacillus aquaticus TaxID=2021314 RepID=A0A235FBA5_9BACL|nr:DHHA1 domain-containing protein [Fictibacillus aquaticus]OYD58626.1 hydrolase [Fictibacillus aquaticus]
MKNKLFYSSSYITKWETKIISRFERNGKNYIVLEETAFYPHGGGQPCDKGIINGIEVLDVFRENDVIFHQIESFPETEDVHCQIDWDKRFDHMQQHTGQHLLSAVCRSKAGAQTLSFHMGTDDVTIDVDKPDISAAELAEIENIVNKEIYQNRLIKSYFVNEAELKSLPVAKMPSVIENIRIVEIEGIEYNACGGTHLARTGELGLIKLYKTEKQKGATRIYFKCGSRALADYETSLQILTELSAKFNTGRSEILDRIEKLEKSLQEQEKQMDLLKEQNDSYLAEELLSQKEGNYISRVFENKPVKDLIILANRITAKHDELVLFASMNEKKIVLSSGKNHTFSCGGFLKEHLSRYHGRGGGSDRSAQAAFNSIEDMRLFCDYLAQYVNQSERESIM